MSDETTPGPDLRKQIAEALRTSVDDEIIAEWICCDPVRADHEMCSKADAARQMARTLLTDDPEWYDAGSPVLDAAMAVVQPELDRRDTEIASLRALWAAVAKTSLERKAEADGRRQHAEQLKAELYEQTRDRHRWRARAEQAEAAVARVKALAQDMRTWCSPHGIAVDYAQRIDEAIEPPDRSDLPAVRAFAAKHDPMEDR